MIVSELSEFIPYPCTKQPSISWYDTSPEGFENGSSF